MFLCVLVNLSLFSLDNYTGGYIVFVFIDFSGYTITSKYG